jgi:hypothetical protein
MGVGNILYVSKITDFKVKKIKNIAASAMHLPTLDPSPYKRVQRLAKLTQSGRAAIIFSIPRTEMEGKINGPGAASVRCSGGREMARRNAHRDKTKILSRTLRGIRLLTDLFIKSGFYWNPAKSLHSIRSIAALKEYNYLVALSSPSLIIS